MYICPGYSGCILFFLSRKGRCSVTLIVLRGSVLGLEVPLIYLYVFPWLVSVHAYVPANN